MSNRKILLDVLEKCVDNHLKRLQFYETGCCILCPSSSDNLHPYRASTSGTLMFGQVRSFQFHDFMARRCGICAPLAPRALSMTCTRNPRRAAPPTADLWKDPLRNFGTLQGQTAFGGAAAAPAGDSNPFGFSAAPPTGNVFGFGGGPSVAAASNPFVGVAPAMGAREASPAGDGKGSGKSILSFMGAKKGRGTAAVQASG